MSGFTLIELLVVIGVIAVLSVVVILTLNPAELLKQARDSNRVADLNTLRTALGHYYADVFTATTTKSYSFCYMSASTSLANCGFTGTWTNTTGTTARAVDGTGWLPVNFTTISSGAPIGSLPVDPLNTVNSTNIYRYASYVTSSYELDAKLESTKQNGATGAAQIDGGNDPALYEVGTAVGLSI